MTKYKVKYARASKPNMIMFGLWNDSTDWVEWKRKEEKKGDEIFFLMSYLDKTKREPNPLIKEVECPALGSHVVTEDYEESEE